MKEKSQKERKNHLKLSSKMKEIEN